MNRASILNLILLCFATILSLAAPVLLKGGLYLSQHEADALHMVQGAVLMAEGAVPHRDFMTPLGLLAFAPIAALMRAGLPVGMAYVLVQLGLAVLLWPALVWAAASRLRFAPAALLCVGVLSLVLAMVYGGADAYVSVSMYYNRWAWALATVAIILAVLRPSYRHSQILDGLVLGLCLSGLGLLKVTYLVAFLPAIVIALSLRGQVLAIAVALIVGSLAILMVNTALGPDVMWAYVGDLLSVLQSPVRPYPGLDLAGVALAPQYVAATAVLLFSVVLLRQGARRIEGLALLLLAPGFIYVSYQNFGNDPVWLLALAVLIFALTPLRLLRNQWDWDLRRAYTAAGVASLALAASIWANYLASPFRMALEDRGRYQHMLPEAAAARDLYVLGVRAADVRYVAYLEGPTEGQEGRAGDAVPNPGSDPGSDPRPVPGPGQRDGAADPADCQILDGVVTLYQRMAEDLRDGVPGDAPVFVADVFSPLWLMGVGRPAPGAAIWNYGQIDGAQDARFVVEPRCAVRDDVRSIVMQRLKARYGARMTQVLRNDRLTLYRLQPPAQGAAQSTTQGTGDQPPASNESAR
ncbi:hypothetical protein [Brevirhabdus sp.]|uniref:hypothetical protein n=1 Tax=Brevirhabdus sp. TaxID=2004514 RepID=UPI004059DFCB